MVPAITNGTSDHYKASVDEWIQTDTVGGVVHIDLPAITAAQSGAWIATVKESTGGFNNVRIHATNGDRIDDNGTPDGFVDNITAFQIYFFVSNGVDKWFQWFAN